MRIFNAENWIKKHLNVSGLEGVWHVKPLFTNNLHLKTINYSIIYETSVINVIAYQINCIYILCDCLREK